MPHPSDEQPHSDYPELKLPVGGWQSTIPSHLLDGATPADRWMMEEMSKNTQATEFCVRAALSTNEQVRLTNGRLRAAESQLVDLEDDMDAAKSDVSALGSQFRRIKPFLDSLTTARTLLKSKVFRVMLLITVLFLLGYNRDTLISILKLLG